MLADLSSGDLARVTGNTVRTIRFYAEQGLLEPTLVSDGGHRRYTLDDVERLQLISDLRELGLSLGDIRRVMEIRAGCHTATEFAARFQEELAGHLDQAQRRLERLRRVKRELHEAVDTLQARLAADRAPQCACALGAEAGAPRIVKVLARQQGCCGAPPHATAGGQRQPES